MRILVVGAGAVGGYFGGRLIQAGRDVTFLVRPARAAQLARGLSIESPVGSVSLPAPKVVGADTLGEPFDLMLLSCKAYDLEAAMASFAPAVGADSMVLPLLNGMRHLDTLDGRFGADRVLGGLCAISSVLGPGGEILHLNDLQTIVFGERDGSSSDRMSAIATAFEGTRVDVRVSQAIVQEMWEKWVFIAAAAGITCLMRASVGDVVAAGGAPMAVALLDECAAIAAAEGHPPGPAALTRSRDMLTASGSPLKASMLRDIEGQHPVEGDHIIGDLLRRGEARWVPTPLLRVANTHLRAYEAARERTGSAAKTERTKT
jgi:2-dehydropantoate 2-reductase